MLCPVPSYLARNCYAWTQPTLLPWGVCRVLLPICQYFLSYSSFCFLSSIVLDSILCLFSKSSMFIASAIIYLACKINDLIRYCHVVIAFSAFILLVERNPVGSKFVTWGWFYHWKVFLDQFRLVSLLVMPSFSSSNVEPVSLF